VRFFMISIMLMVGGCFAGEAIQGSERNAFYHYLTEYFDGNENEAALISLSSGGDIVAQTALAWIYRIKGGDGFHTERHNKAADLSRQSLSDENPFSYFLLADMYAAGNLNVPDSDDNERYIVRKERLIFDYYTKAFEICERILTGLSQADEAYPKITFFSGQVARKIAGIFLHKRHDGNSPNGE